MMSGSTLSAVLEVLHGIAPLELAEEWDNVGLLVEPPAGRAVRRVLLTIDLTEPVLDEALASGAELVVAYHPPIFRAVKRLTLADPKQRIVLRAVAAGVAVFSPHTALDAAPGGVNDWLADGLGAGLRRGLYRPRERLRWSAGVADRHAVAGQGREVVLERAVPLAVLVGRIKRWVGLRRLRVATAAAHAAGGSIERVALCAGAGAAVILGSGADLLLTGEMGHHDVLAATQTGQSVVLCDHTNTERGFLPRLRERLAGALGGAVDVAVSRLDRDPLQIT